MAPYYTVDVTSGYISPSGFTEKSLDIPPLHIASVTTDFDRDGQTEIVGSPLSEDTPDTDELQAAIFAIYERLPSGRYRTRTYR